MPEIRQVSSQDTPRLSAIHNAAFPIGQGWSEAMVTSSLENMHVSGYGLSVDNIMLGFILCQHVSNEGEILTLAVDPDHQRHGYGHALVEHSIAILSKRKTKSVFLEVSEHNHAARALYRSLGFQETGKRKGYYHTSEGAENAITMELIPDESANLL